MLRTVSIAVPMLFLLTPVTACSATVDSNDRGTGIAASGTGDTRQWAVKDFDTVGLGGGGDVEVRTGAAFGLTATGTPAALDKVKITRDGSALNIGRKKGVTWGPADKVRFIVTMPKIKEADIGGSGNIVINRVEGENFAGNIGGSGNLDVRSLTIDKASFNIGGSGNIAAAGTAKSLNVSIGGSGRLRTAELTAQIATITVAGSGDIQATVTNDADITIVGAGDVTIGGGAKCKVTKMGSGSVRCG